MFKKIAFKLFRALCVSLCFSVVTCGLTTYYALQEPAYYAVLRANTPTPEEVAAAAENLEYARTSYLRWRNETSAGLARGVAGPVPPTHEVSFTAAELNALLAGDSKSVGGGQVEAPRFRITEDRIDVALGVQTSAAHFVLSAGLAPSLDRDGVLTLDVESVRLGRLPLPCKTVARFFPRESHRLSGSLSLDLTDASQPRLQLDLADKAGLLLIDSLACAEGKLTLRFVAEQQPTPLARVQ